MLLEAKPYVEKEIERLKNIVAVLPVQPHLTIIRVGDDMASGVYIRNKVRMCEQIGITHNVMHIDSNVTTDDLIYIIQESVNSVPEISGCIVQLPLPDHIDERKVLDSIRPLKDVDGLGAVQIGWLRTKDPRAFKPCTPKGIIDLLHYYDVDLKGLDVAIINASEIVGKPLAELMLQEKATPTICHSKTQFLRDIMKHSDIVVTAIGKAGYFNHLDFNPGTIIVDVSMNRDENGKLCGDVKKSDYDVLQEMGCQIVPVPGGVGRTTVLSLMKNVIKACCQQIESELDKIHDNLVREWESRNR